MTDTPLAVASACWPTPEDEHISLKHLCLLASQETGMGQPYHIQTVRNWANPAKGRLGCTLKTAIVMGTRMTTRKWWEEFKAEVTAAGIRRSAELRDRMIERGQPRDI